MVFATNNYHKLEEVRRMLPSRKIVGLQDIGCTVDIPETSDTLEGNALQKARYVRQHFHLDCFADDTGLEVEALGNAPGVYSARYAGEHDFEANIDKLLHNLRHETNRRARFRTVIALLWKDEEHLFEGIVRGNITTERRGDGGFGYDSVFIPETCTRTFAELGNDLKNRISHRAIAIQHLSAFLVNS